MNPNDSPESAQSLLNRSSWMPRVSPGWARCFRTARGSNNKSMEPSRHLKTFCLGENCFRPSRSDLIWFFDIFFAGDQEGQHLFLCAWQTLVVCGKQQQFLGIGPTTSNNDRMQIYQQSLALRLRFPWLFKQCWHNFIAIRLVLVATAGHPPVKW